MRIVVTGPIHRQGGITTNAVLLASYIAYKHETLNLLIDSQFTYGTLQDIVYPQAADNISEVFTFAKTNTLTPENLLIHTNSVVEKHLKLLGATKQKLVNENMNECLPSILKNAKGCFDYTFIDTNAGLRDEITCTSLEEADIIVVCLPQDDFLLKRFFIDRDSNFWSDLYSTKNTIFVIGRYDEKFEHYALRKIKRKFKLNELYAIPNSEMVNKAIYEGRLLKWMSSNYDSKEDIFPYLDEISQRIIGTTEKKGIQALLAAF